jgi:hypothetical protein
MCLDLDGVSERLKQPTCERLAPADHDSRQPSLEGQGTVGELLALLAPPAHRRPEVLSDRAAQEG